MDTQVLVFQFDDVRVDVPNAQVFKAGRRAPLEPKAFQVLVFLLQHPGRLIEKEELLSAIWADTFVTENALTRAIAVLRKTLGDTKAEPKYIETVPTRGYRFIASVTQEQSAQAAVEAINAGGEGVSSLGRARRRKWIWIVAGIASAMGLGVASVRYLRLHDKQTFEPPDFRLFQATTSTALDMYPSFSPDGNTIAYCSDEHGSFEIYLRQLTRGGSVVQLTNDGERNMQPAWSPDGATIAYYSAGRGGIWLIPALGGVARQLTTFGSSPAWSPDGTQIVFESEGVRGLQATEVISIFSATLWVASVRDGTIRQLTERGKPPGAHNSPAWSPDGKSIAFVNDGLDVDAALWTIAPDGNQLKRIGSAGVLFNPVFARDGRHLYTSAWLGIWEVSLDGAGEGKTPEHRKLFESEPEVDRYLAISPDGKKIAFSRVTTTSNIYSLSMVDERAGGSPIMLTHDTRIRKTNPSISPDGSRVLFDVGSADRNGGVWLSDADGKNSSPVLAPCGQPTWLASGEDFLCVNFRKSPNPNCEGEDCYTVDVWKVHLPEGTHEKVQHIEQNASFFDFTRDGKQVAFMSKKGGAPNVWVSSIGGNAPPRQVTFDTESMGFPKWSPDGKVLSVEQKLGDSTYIWVVKPGEKPEQVTFAPGQNWPGGWSPDGSKVVFAACRDGVWNLWWVSLKDHKEKRITSYTRQNEYVRYPVWATTGKAIDYEYAETTANVWVLELDKP